MRLFRALPKKEYILNSYCLCLENINLLDEIYSHIIPTHKLKSSKNKKIIFSFTDDIEIAYKLIKNHSEIYDRIGYIDIEFTEEFSTLNYDENIVFVKSVHKFSDWIDLAVYEIIKNKTYNKIIVKNVNYNNDKGKPLINTLVPSRWGALSLARSFREYAVICNNLIPIILSNEEIEYEINNKRLIEHDNKLFFDNEIFLSIENVMNNIKRDVQVLQITTVRKKYIESELEDYLIKHQ